MLTDLSFLSSFTSHLLSIERRGGDLIDLKGTAETLVVRSDHAALADPLIITPDSSMDNVSFSEMVCTAMSSGPVTEFVVDSSSVTQPFLLPDCLFDYSNLGTISAYSIIVPGNATYPDPLVRLAAVSNIKLTNSFLSTYGSTSNAYTPDWTQVFGLFPTIAGLTFQSCRLTGALPPSLPATLLTFSIGSNAITGTIPSGLFSNYATTPVASPVFYWFLSNNKLSGNLPPNLLVTLPPQSAFSLYLEYNQLIGTIPRSFLSLSQASTANNILVTVNNNSIVDTLPSDLWGLPTSMPALKGLSIYISSNTITGTIPTTFISSYSFPAMTTFILAMANCQLSGSLHTGILPMLAPTLSQYTLYMSNNPLNAPIASNLISTLLSNSFTSPAPSITINCQHCSITGSLALPTPPSSVSNLPRLTLLLAFNSLTSFTANEGTSKYLYWMQLMNNTALQGNVDNLFSSSSSVLSILNTDYTALSGTMPFMALMNTSLLQTLSMEGTAIDFCSGGENRTSWNVSVSLSACSLRKSTAFYCSGDYPLCATSVPPPMAPQAPVTPTIPNPAPAATAAPTPVGCPGTRPSDEFVCVNGVWTSTGSVTAPTLVISPGTSEVVVIGNVTSGTVVLQGIGSSITVTGCFTNLSVVTIQLTPEDLKKLGSHSEIELLRSDGNCSDYSSVAVATTVTRSSCRTVKVDKAATTAGSLNGIFSVSSSGCNLWWIILVSVLAALAIGGMIALLVILHVRKQNSVSKAKATLHG